MMPSQKRVPKYFLDLTHTTPIAKHLDIFLEL